MSEQILTNELFVNLSNEEQEIVKAGQFVGPDGYGTLGVLGGGYGYPDYGGYSYPGYGGYGYPGFAYYPGFRSFNVFPGAVSGY